MTQTLAWGSTYYLPAILADPVCEALGVSRAWFFGCFSAALLLSGIVGPMAGRMIDKHGGRDVLTAANVVFALGLIAMAGSSGPMTLGVAWLLLGLGMGFGLYEAAFATVAGLWGRDARSAITGIALFAGFATVGWPASAFFIEALGWRGACVAWAMLHILMGLPLNRFRVPKAPPPAPLAPAPEHASTAGLPCSMIVLAAVFGATVFVSTALAAHMPRLFEGLGIAPTVAVLRDAIRLTGR